jgi:hypothetical protein
MKHIGAELRQTSCLPVSSETPSLERHVKPTLQPTSTSGQILRDCNRQDKTASRAPIERFFVALAIVGFAGLIASVVWMLLEHALQFERMAAEKSNPELKSEFEKQVANSSALSAKILRSEAWYLIAWSPTAPQYVFERVRRFLVRRHKVQGHGNRRFTFDVIHRELGVLCLQRLPRAVPSCALRRSQSESRMPEIGSSGLMSGEWETGRWP